MIVSPLSLWTVSTGMGQGEGVILETGNVTRGSKSGSGGHHGYYVHVTRGKSSGDVGSPWIMWICDPRCRVWHRWLPWKLEM